jgi:pyridoxal phosphate enzyme (YggS family)
VTQPDFDPASARADILARIATAATSVGCEAGDVTLAAVSKQQPDERIIPVLDAGQTVFAENRVQEAAERWGRLGREGLELRLIGPLQTNKSEEAVALFDVIETLDRERLADALAKACARIGRTPRLYVQVNTGEEAQKAGVAPREADDFIKTVRDRYGLTIEGLMCIPPAEEPPAAHFALLADIAARNGLAKLSMGMSADFETAVRFGATSVRVGTALFGGQ